MKKEEIKQLIKYNVVDTPVYINNDIFDDIKNCKVIEHISQQSFAYGYYCIITYLYRNAKYNQHFLKQKEIKHILGYSPTNSKVDFLVKKGGVLDELGYTRSITDFPVCIPSNKIIKYDTYQNVKNQLHTSSESLRNFKVKFPVRAFFKSRDSEYKERLDGSYFNAENCHLFDIEMFIDCLGDEELGCTGFYIASYIKYLNITLETGRFGNTFVLNELNISKKSILKYLWALEKNNIIDVKIRHGYNVQEISLFLRNQLKEWRDHAFRKHGAKCLVCGSTENLVIHHVDEPFSLIRDRVFEQCGIQYKQFDEYSHEELEFLKYRIIHEHKDVEGVPLRDDIHKLYHCKYPKINNKHSLLEFKSRYVNGEFKE
ncbi:hypothetical protein [Ammoniphilus sp. 3BR4]|uniref:hypothetical protein n=1 Tax=Ammoniphilus sp. 3BR4 TaxID=3158265 RepID=UPI0034672079